MIAVEPVPRPYRMACQTCQRITDHDFTKVRRVQYYHRGQIITSGRFADLRCLTCKTLRALIP